MPSLSFPGQSDVIFVDILQDTASLPVHLTVMFSVTVSPPVKLTSINSGDAIISCVPCSVADIGMDADNNKSIGQLSRETGLSKDKVRYILHNPVYKGMVRWMGDTRRGRHDPMVNSELFDRVQEKLKGGRKFGFRSLPSEYYYDLQGRVCVNLEKAERIKRLWQLRLKKMNRAEIAEELGINFLLCFLCWIQRK